MKIQKAYSNMPDHLLTETVMLCIHLLELFGIFVIVFGCIKAFLQYLRGRIYHGGKGDQTGIGQNSGFCPGV